MFASLRPDAVVISYQWDYWVSASYYEQIVGGFRPDVTVIDKELLRRSWYLKELERRRPWIIASSKAEVSAFLHQVDLFEHGLPYDPAQIQARYEGMIESFIRRSMSTHPVYVTGEIEPAFTRGLTRVPEGLAFRLSPDRGERPSPLASFTYRGESISSRICMIRRKPENVSKTQVCTSRALPGADGWLDSSSARMCFRNPPRNDRMVSLLLTLNRNLLY
jgi:hypothetical protein